MAQENVDVFDTYTQDERAAIVRGWDGNKLIDGYNWYFRNFDPLNHDRCLTFEIIRAEILRRIKGA